MRINRTLQIEASTACNLDCTICLRRNQERPKKNLSFSSFKRILDSCHFRYAGLHGWGEPLLNPDVFEMVKYARSKGVITNLTTNGTLLGGRTEEIFKSGLEEIAFGVYDPELFFNVMPQIKGFLRKRAEKKVKFPRTYLDITLYHENQNQILDLIRTASDMGVDSVILHRLFDLHGLNSNISCLSPKEEKDLFKAVKQLSRSLKIKLYLPQKHRNPCLIVRRSLFVTVDGMITPCTYLMAEFMGNAFQGDLSHVLTSLKYKNFVRNMKTHPFCGKCRW